MAAGDPAGYSIPTAISELNGCKKKKLDSDESSGTACVLMSCIYCDNQWCYYKCKPQIIDLCKYTDACRHISDYNLTFLVMIP